MKKLLQLQPDYENRVFGLDLMRTLAIIFVVLGHGQWLLGIAGTDFPWIPLIDGVEMFFVLSGFLIGGIIIRQFESSQKITLKTIGNFWIRRWFRTLPNYYLILLVNAVFVYFGWTNENIKQFDWSFFLFLQNFNSPLVDFFWESWSLSIEEWFYILFPLILGLLYLSLKYFNVSKKHIFLIATGMFLITPLLLRMTVASSYQVDNFWLEAKIYKVVVYRLDGIALGLFAAYLRAYCPQFLIKTRNPFFILGLLISYILIYTSSEPNSYFSKVFFISLQSIGCFLLLPKFASMQKAPKLITKIVTHISLISYSMYLINLGLVSSVIRANFYPNDPITASGWYVVYWIIVLLVSTLLFKYFERPILKIRDKLTQ